VKRKVYKVDRDKVVTCIIGVGLIMRYLSPYSSIYNEMIRYTGNNILMVGKFQGVHERQGANCECYQSEEGIVCGEIIWSIEILNNKSKKKWKKLTQLMTTMGLHLLFSSYYLLYLIDRFGFVIYDRMKICVFYANENG
jgi:hypothetical protein